jgi:hypothetical protein
MSVISGNALTTHPDCALLISFPRRLVWQSAKYGDGRPCLTLAFLRAGVGDVYEMKRQEETRLEEK